MVVSPAQANCVSCQKVQQHLGFPAFNRAEQTMYSLTSQARLYGPRHAELHSPGSFGRRLRLHLLPLQVRYAMSMLGRTFVPREVAQGTGLAFAFFYAFAFLKVISTDTCGDSAFSAASVNIAGDDAAGINTLPG